ncbi:hypothetical protein B5M44_11610 [Shinella sumterensis]|uniref:DUF5334 family protein n=1 Tax=Shinella sumterensis TaxID=1967501 RepID=UPI00106E92B5|nr:DUF5334 family protein [Shinella sumterensis]MCD1265536.1 hypothetical protein [Shinella sumterensis]TFE98256.1 hypothetical protein B5M44_11610 [Shinella sumterensis]
MRMFAVAAFAVAFVGSNALAWDGVDSSTGGAVEIEKGNLVRRGETIEIYDSSSGSYRDVDVESIQRYGNSVEVEVYDSESGEYRTFEMEDD